MATLVAGGAQPAEVFGAVADELARLIGAEATLGRDSGKRNQIPEYGSQDADLSIGIDRHSL